ncbi:hypothetical protein N7466_005266 [Penicillium verhagenii]|uniref:uncharacterized protein n=1 Tax=Penicillium verhagenii TaxID=1562060 RepID=UPI002544EA72|nr:uncharacterized protein N7466_005266 [Penicillium verhagenii]KAJ5935719.1 hypothetical protein N7466_005266 [Penicillium verhagenii]
MRYENWDVLLFPEHRNVPIQEFKTQCFVTRDTNSPYLHFSTAMGPPSYYPTIQGNIGQVPVLTSFIPSMPKDSGFRVSVHSWEKPRPSRFMEKLMQAGDVLVFEARIFVDGQLIGGGVFGQKALWPYVIDLSSNIDRDGNQDSLRFPAFHPEILDQQHWDAGDLFGRIKVIISEGFARPNRSPPFERVKDVISLSFQHAPLSILEYSNIAWPNSNMWTDALRADSKYNSTRNPDGPKPDDTTPHGHSPSRAEPRSVHPTSSESSGSRGEVYNAWVSNRAFPVPISQWDRQGSERRLGYHPDLYADRYFEPFTIATENLIGDLTNNETWHHRGAQSSREDVPMPDYSSTSSSRVFSSVTGMSYEHSKQPSMATPIDDDQYNDLVQSLTPTKLPPTIGTRAPSNTPSALLAAAKPSAEQARSTALSQSSTRASALRELSQSSTRNVSGSSIKSLSSEKFSTPSKLGNSPKGNIKGKKERTKEKSKEHSQKSLGEVAEVAEVAEAIETAKITDVKVEDPKENVTPRDIEDEAEGVCEKDTEEIVA